jgi:DNA replication protein DnaC
VLKKFYEAGITSKLVKTAEILTRIKETYSPLAKETESAVLDSYNRVNLLILDEFGGKNKGAKLTQTEKALIFEIIDYRYERMLPTVIISNMAKEQLEAFIGDEGILDRLLQHCTEVVFNWESYR